MDLTTIRVNVASAPYDVVVGDGACAAGFLGSLGHELRPDRTAVVADERVLELHGSTLLGSSAPGTAAGPPVHALTGGEGAKELAVLGEVLEFCADAGLSRNSILVTFGGGSIGDLGGLAASLFKRGVGVVHVPTTLLAQVDASVGGKTAINLSRGKNLAGTFHQPRAVFCDTGFLATLPDDEFASGMGEVVKSAIIGGESTLARLEALADAVLRRERDALAQVVGDCVGVKAAVVAADPDERGERKTLNLGHTFAHAIEHAAGYGRVPHGVAVGTGLALAAIASERVLGTDRGDGERVAALLARFDLPTSLGALSERYRLDGRLTPAALREGLGHDKKGAVGEPLFVLAEAPGVLRWDVRLDPELLAELLAA